jgi:general stress protein YciG
MFYTANMAKKRGSSKPLPAAVELGRRGGRARVAQLTREELQELGRRGGQTRAKRLSREQRREIARRAVRARWEKAKVKESAEEGTRG